MAAIKKLEIVNEEIVLNHSIREYNPYEWTKIVERYKKYDPTFYMDKSNNNFYVAYTIPNEFKAFTELSYISCLSTATFVEIAISPDGELDYVDREIRYSNSPIIRQLMTNLSKNGSIFTNQF